METMRQSPYHEGREIATGPNRPSPGRLQDALERHAARLSLRPSDGRGYKAWETRRRNLFRTAVHTLSRAGRVTDIEARRAAADQISEYLSHRLPPLGLPRSYSIRSNGFGELSLALGQVLFSPSVVDELPTEQALQRLADDLSTGWLEEIQELLSKWSK